MKVKIVFNDESEKIVETDKTLSDLYAYIVEPTSFKGDTIFSCVTQKLIGNIIINLNSNIKYLEKIDD